MTDDTLPVRAHVPPRARARYWGIGEHIAVIGTTGTGKTYLITKLVELRNYVVVLRTKPDNNKFPGFKRSKTPDALNDLHSNKILIDLSGMPPKEQRPRALDLMDLIWEQSLDRRYGGWTFVMDEVFYLDHVLKLRDKVEMLFTQGRSLGISLVGGVQRPAWVSRFTMSEASHIFSFRVEGGDTKRVLELTTPRIKPYIGEALPRHHFVHCYIPGGFQLTVGEANKLNSILQVRTGKI